MFRLDAPVILHVGEGNSINNQDTYLYQICQILLHFVE